MCYVQGEKDYCQIKRYKKRKKEQIIKLQATVQIIDSTIEQQYHQINGAF